MSIEQSLAAMGATRIGTSGNDKMYGSGSADSMSGGLGGNDRVEGRGGNDRLHGGFRARTDNPNGAVDRDVMVGGAGGDVFVSMLAHNVQGWDGYGTTTLGSNVDLVEDFQKGTDRLDVAFWEEDAGSWTFRHGGFSLFDSNGDGKLTAADDNVSVGNLTFKGVTKQTITLDVAGAQIDAGYVSAGQVEGAAHTLSVWGVDSLTASNFVGNNTESGSLGGNTPTSPPASPPSSPPVSPPASPPPAESKPGATIDGSNGKNTLIGTKDDDYINGHGGSDTIRGGAGRDYLNGGSDRYKADLNDGRDRIYGQDGDDMIDGGNNNDRLYGDAGNDYINGGLGGNDRIEGGAGNDRLVGGFRGPQDTPGDPVDRDVLVGGPGADVFEPRFWIKQSGWDGMGSNALGPNVDLVLDFEQGVDKFDTVVYRQASQGFEFHQGGFEAFDTNNDGVLTNADAHVSVGMFSYRGDAELSITLDVGAANLAAGRLAASELEAGDHKMTLFGIGSLTQDDFVPTNTYYGKFGNGSTMNGTARNDYIGAKGGDSVIDGKNGNDLLEGDGGRDIFKMSYNSKAGPGADLVVDFTPGQDKLDGSYTVNGNNLRFDFSRLDTNKNGVLDNGDEAVHVEQATAYQPGRGIVSEVSTIIDLDVAFDISNQWTGKNSITTIGITGLTADDFVHPGDDLLIA
ncbi:MAG: calcium-binding protein [Pseudomonadota bacterium]